MGKHEFAGQCSENQEEMKRWKTFSVGVFEVIPKKAGDGTKRGPVKVRVIGSTDNPELVYEEAKRIVRELDDGTYRGPKNVNLAKS